MMKMKAILLAAIVAAWSYNSYAGDTPERGEPVSTFDSNFTFRMTVSFPFAGFTIDHWDRFSEDYNYEDISYSDNSPLNLGISIAYREYGISFSQKIANIEDEKTYGSTDSTDVQIFFYERKYGLELMYQRKKGMYLEEPGRYGYQPGDPETKRSDIRQTNYHFNAFYVFSDDFSFKAAFYQLERQNKWDWTFMLMGSVNYNELRSRYSIIPQSIDTESIFGDHTGYRGGHYFSAGVLPGLGVTVPIRDFFITGAFLVGIGYTYDSSDTDSGTSVRHYSNFILNIKSSVGYSGDTYFTGMTINAHSVANGANFSEESGNEVQFYSTEIILFFGFRM